MLICTPLLLVLAALKQLVAIVKGTLAACSVVYCWNASGILEPSCQRQEAGNLELPTAEVEEGGRGQVMMGWKMGESGPERGGFGGSSSSYSFPGPNPIAQLHAHLLQLLGGRPPPCCRGLPPGEGNHFPLT